MSKDLSADGVAPEEWKPLHPLTYLPRVLGSVTGIIGAVTLANASALAAWLSGETPTGIESGLVFLGLAAIAVVILAVSGLYSYLAWRMTRYAVTSTAVWYRAGIFMRTQRHARLSRIQTVNVSYSLLGRIVGLGYLDIEVAGGQDATKVLTQRAGLVSVVGFDGVGGDGLGHEGVPSVASTSPM